MTNKEEVRFWKKAIKMLKKGYGADCKELDMNCAGCRAELMISWIHGHIELIEY